MVSGWDKSPPPPQGEPSLLGLLAVAALIALLALYWSASMFGPWWR